MEQSSHILVVDDHRDIRDPLAKYLQQHGFRVTKADSAAAARVVLKKSAIDLLVLDIMMPGEDGLSLCRYVRETIDVPIVLLTAMTEEMDRIIGLEVGADDYVTKPFNPRELVARIKSVLRRSHALPPRQRAQGEELIRFAGWTLSPSQREISGSDGVAIPLSTGEFRLLMAFIDHPNMILNRDQLLDLTQGREADVFDRSIDNQVSRLRRKIEEDPKTPRLIKTVWGGGYSFAAEVERS